MAAPFLLPLPGLVIAPVDAEFGRRGADLARLPPGVCTAFTLAAGVIIVGEDARPGMSQFCGWSFQGKVLLAG